MVLLPPGLENFFTTIKQGARFLVGNAGFGGFSKNFPSKSHGHYAMANPQLNPARVKRG